MLELAPPIDRGPRPLGTPPPSDLCPVAVNSTSRVQALAHTCSPGYNHSPAGSAAPHASLSPVAHPFFLPSRFQCAVQAAARDLPSSPVPCSKIPLVKGSPCLLLVPLLFLWVNLGAFPPSLGAQQPFHAQIYMVSGALTRRHPRCLSIWLHHLLRPGRGPSAVSVPSPFGHRCVPQAGEPGTTHSARALWEPLAPPPLKHTPARPQAPAISAGAASPRPVPRVILASTNCVLSPASPGRQDTHHPLYPAPSNLPTPKWLLLCPQVMTLL